MVVEEAEGLAWIDGFEPEGNAAEFDGHGVEIDAVEAATGDLAEGVAVVVGADGAVWGFDFGEFFCEAAGGGEEEMAGAAGGVADTQAQESMSGE